MSTGPLLPHDLILIDTPLIGDCINERLGCEDRLVVPVQTVLHLEGLALLSGTVREASTAESFIGVDGVLMTCMPLPH